MLDLIEKNRHGLESICDRLGVDRLALFGSAAMGRFRPGESDLDFVVNFSERSPTAVYADRFLDFADALEDLFQHPVHLITAESIRNPYLREEIRSTAQVVYSG